MTGIMRHRETYYELLHAKITKYVDLLLFIVMIFDSFSLTEQNVKMCMEFLTKSEV